MIQGLGHLSCEDRQNKIRWWGSFLLRVVRRWNKLLREIVDVPFLEVPFLKGHAG